MARRDGRRSYGPAARGLPVALLGGLSCSPETLGAFVSPSPSAGPPCSGPSSGKSESPAAAPGLRLGVADVAHLALAGVLLDVGLRAV